MTRTSTHTVLALACALALAGCAGHEDSTPSAVPAPAGQEGAAPPRAGDQPSPAGPVPGASPAAVALGARLDGFGPLTLGMSIEQAGQAWPGLFNNLPRLAAGACFHANPGGDELAYFGFMFDDGRFVRYGGGNEAIAVAQRQEIGRAHV